MKTPAATGIKSAFVETPTGDYVRILRAGEGPIPVVFVHGWPACGRSYWPFLIHPGMRRACRIVAPDLPGFGQTRESAGPLTIERLARALCAVVESEFDRPCILVGASFGGRVALEAAALRPKLFSRMMLLAPLLHAGHANRNCVVRILRGFPRAARTLLRPPFTWAAGVWVLMRSIQTAGPGPKTWRHGIPMARDISHMRLQSSELASAVPDGRPLLTRLRVPTELWYGDRDWLLDVSDYESIPPRTGLTIRRLAGAGHGLQFSHVQQIVEAIVAR